METKTDGVIGLFSKFKINDIEIAECTSITGPGNEADVVEFASFDFRWKEHKPAHFDGGEISLELIYSNDKTDTLFGFLGVEAAFTIEYPDGATWECEGFLQSIETTATHDDKIESAATIKVSGEPTFTPVHTS